MNEDSLCSITLACAHSHTPMSGCSACLLGALPCCRRAQGTLLARDGSREPPSHRNPRLAAKTSAAQKVMGLGRGRLWSVVGMTLARGGWEDGETSGV